ncbi:von Willebrand factor type A [Coprobacillus sp. CAG:698]|nr:von Willebrand factor type A [Coprobacillus sp. CAG:698]
MKRFVSKILGILMCMLLLFLIGCSSVKPGYLKDAESGFKGIDSDPMFSLDGFNDFTDSASTEDIIMINNKYPLYEAIYNANIKAGVLTGSVVFDNENYEFWNKLISNNQNGKGLFEEYENKYSFNTKNRVRIQVKNAPNVSVEMTDGSFATFTDANGYAYLYPEKIEDKYEVYITYNDVNKDKKKIKATIKNDDVISLTDKTYKNDVIELMFVIDTTGSMGDEINYLKVEIDDVISEIQEKNPNTIIKLALLFYRDKGDEYVTRYFDFTQDIQKQKNNLSNQNANGGGDFEEAVYKALGEAVDKQWSSSSETRVLVHVADAPSHDNEVKEWNKNVLKLTKKGIKVISVASSGIDKKTEYFFRSQSMITGGCYVYLTDDSGVGGTHIEATTEVKPVVEYLNKLLIRLINGYHTGNYGTAESYDGLLSESDLPEEMPQDFNFTFKWGNELTSSFDLKTKKLILNNGIDEESINLDVTEEDVKKIYKLLRIVNLQNVTISEEKAEQALYLKVTYGDVEKEVYFTYPNKVINNKTDYTFYLMCRGIYNYLIKSYLQKNVNSNNLPE